MTTIAVKIWPKAEVIFRRFISILNLFWKNRFKARQNPLCPSGKELEQAGLMGMYLCQANNKPVYAAPGIEWQSRTSGRRYTIRERTPRLPR